MKKFEEMTQKEIKDLEKYPWSIDQLMVREIYILPTRNKHDSGWGTFITAAYIGGRAVLIGDCHDSMEIRNAKFDTIVKNGLLRFFPNGGVKTNKGFVHYNGFIIEHRLSDFEAEGGLI